MKKITLLASLCLMTTLCKAYDFKDGDCYYTITSLADLTVALTNSGEYDYSSSSGSYDYVACYNGDFRVPETAVYADKTFTVTSIGVETFNSCVFTTLTIPETILSAYISGCSMENLVIEDSDTPLKNFEMYDAICKNVYVGRNTSTFSGYYSTSYAFHGNNTLQSVMYGDKVTYICGEELSDCPNLETVILSDNVKVIGRTAFADCPKLKNISGKGINIIYSHAFTNCISLESFDFPNLKRIEDGDSQKGTYRWGVFQGCTSLKNVVLPQGLMYLGTLAFRGCTSLESVVLPASLSQVADYSADSNYDYSYVFSNCPNLKSITVNSPTPIAIGESTFDTQTYIGATLKVPVGAMNTYQSTEIWKNFFNIEEDGSIKDDVRVLTINNNSWSEKGSVEYLGKVIGYGASETFSTKVGESVEVRFIPIDGYRVNRVMVNDDDMTSQVKDNVLSLTITGNLSLSVEFDELPIYLTIKHAENGAVKQEVSSGRTYSFVIEPSVGWRLHSVSYNDADITSQIGSDGTLRINDITKSSVLSIAFEAENTAIGNMPISQAKVYGKDGNIVISNAEIGEMIQIFNESGINVSTIQATRRTETIKTIKGHIYIVKLNGKTVKIAI